MLWYIAPAAFLLVVYPEHYEECDCLRDFLEANQVAYLEASCRCNIVSLLF